MHFSSLGVETRGTRGALFFALHFLCSLDFFFLVSIVLPTQKGKKAMWHVGLEVRRPTCEFSCHVGCASGSGKSEPKVRG